jgi:ABC-type amino acid transport substrate-binding protein
LVGVPLTDEKYGIAVGKKEVELAAALNIALAKLKEDGTLERIQRKWLEPK